MKVLQKYAVVVGLCGTAAVYGQTAAPTMSSKRLRAEEVKKELEADNRHVLHLQSIARKEKDVIKLTCINDKLVQIKAQMNIADTASLQLEAEEAVSAAALSEIETAHADVKRLRSEADGCAGELEMYKQESASDFQAPELDDPTQGGPYESSEQLGEPDVDQPAYATPWQ